MTEELLCPECGTKFERKLGLPALVYNCPGCKKDFVKCLNKLVERGQFHDMASKWHE